MIYKQIQRINMFQSNLPSLLSFLSKQAQLVFIMTGWTTADVGTVASRWSKSEQRGYVPTTPGPHRHAMCTPWNPPDAWHPHKQNDSGVPTSLFLCSGCQKGGPFFSRPAVPGASLGYVNMLPFKE